MGLLIAAGESLWTDDNDVLGGGASLVSALLTLVRVCGAVDVFDMMSRSAINTDCCTHSLKMSACSI